MKIACYTMRHDSGFAPNPFHGYCTLGACTPNHRNFNIKQGDWIVGTSTAAEGYRLMHAMHIFETMDHDQYFRDPRFSAKIPKVEGTWKQRCGDNIYFRNRIGQWCSHSEIFHGDPASRAQDTKHSKVYIAREFYYFGNMATPLPDWAMQIVKKGQSLKYTKDEQFVDRFVHWLRRMPKSGLIGEPRDREHVTVCRKNSKTRKTIRPCS